MFTWYWYSFLSQTILLSSLYDLSLPPLLDIAADLFALISSYQVNPLGKKIMIMSPLFNNILFQSKSYSWKWDLSHYVDIYYEKLMWE